MVGCGYATLKVFGVRPFPDWEASGGAYFAKITQLYHDMAAAGVGQHGNAKNKTSVSNYEAFVARWALGLDAFNSDPVLRDLARSREYARYGLQLECGGADDVSVDARAYARRDSIWGVFTPAQL